MERALNVPKRGSLATTWIAGSGCVREQRCSLVAAHRRFGESLACYNEAQSAVESRGCPTVAIRRLAQQ